MPITVVVDLQKGDCGKGKIVDYLAPEHDAVFRWNGGAHLVMPWHTLEDAAVERAAGSIGSTKRGIAYAYSDKMRRRGFRLADFAGMGKARSLAAIQNRAAEERKHIRFLYGEKLDYDNGFDYATAECWSAVSHLLEFATRTEELLRRLLDGGARLLGEGAQGYHLDIDFGCYPYVSSSSASAGGIYQGAGIPPSEVPRVIGVAKTYTTYVGSGPFITEMEEGIGRAISDKGKEFGTTTGRRRRVGWFDAVMVREAVRQNACSEMILVKLDVLSGMGAPKFCYIYRSDKGALGRVPAYSEDQKNCRPVYEETLGWDYPLDNAFSLEEIMDSAPEAVDYARTVANFSEVKLLAISTGPHRDQTFFL